VAEDDARLRLDLDIGDGAALVFGKLAICACA
jgi:hypothetical protein